MKEALSNGIQKKGDNADKRNKLNDLNAKEWIINTKSVWLHSDYYFKGKDEPEIRHIRNLILFFTKRNQVLLNPNNNPVIRSIGEEENRIVKHETEESVDFIMLEESSDFTSYSDYKEKLTTEFKKRYETFHGLLKDKQYLCLVVRDFYFYLEEMEHYTELILFHSDVVDVLTEIGFKIKGITIWIPEQADTEINSLDPNDSILHDYILIFRKEKTDSAGTLGDFKALTPSIATLEKNHIYPSFRKSISPPRDKFKAQHPATFPEPDIKNLISFHTDLTENPRVLDPFCGVGSTLLACLELNIEGWGIELTEKWVNLTLKRFHSESYSAPLMIGDEINNPMNLRRFFKSNAVEKQPVQRLLVGDARVKMDGFKDDFFDFIITSPPYWGILSKKIDHKMRKERVGKGLDTKYTEEKDASFKRDLANISTYNEFLNELEAIYRLCYAKLKNGSYMAVIVSDFRDKSDFHLYHCKTAKLLRKIGFKLITISILYQENKNLYPYGYPFAFVSNIHHQYIIIVKKEVQV
ncbi:MAG: DNA methyltransferase [Candidatus Hodarchaeales archaeon]